MALNRTDIYGKTHIGCTRKNNEDRFLIKELQELIIFAVADGMGGHAGGETAAGIVIGEFEKYEFSKNNSEKDLKKTLENAQKAILNKINENPGLDGMGSTATAVVLQKNKAFWIHIGDSRLYFFHDKKIRQITTDHTFIQDLIDDGTISLKEAKTHPLRNVLDQCVGCDEIKPDTGVLHLMNNDRLLLCSDGLTRHLSDSQIKSILAATSVEKSCEQLILTALKMGGADNVTVIVKEFNNLGYSQKNR